MSGFGNLRSIFDLAKNEEKIKDIELQLNDPSVWKNREKADRLSRELKGMRRVIGPYNEAKKRYDSLKELCDIVEDTDIGSIEDLMKEARGLQADVDKLEMKCILGDEADGCDAIVSINAGAGGTESCDWAAMLFRMYLRWAEEHGHACEIIEQLAGEEAGVKSATFIVKGDLAYGYLKTERGVHRLVRISPFDSNKRRHTSFASVDILPDVDKTIDMVISESELRIDTFRSSGAGGQHVNVTDSAVRITHLPTGIVAQCQKERSQHKNKATAMKLLRARLYEKKKTEQEESLMKISGDKKKIEWGSQIRSYVLHPYKMVKDHRTDEETSNAEKVLNGWLDPFMEKYLKKMAAKS